MGATGLGIGHRHHGALEQPVEHVRGDTIGVRGNGHVPLGARGRWQHPVGPQVHPVPPPGGDRGHLLANLGDQMRHVDAVHLGSLRLPGPPECLVDATTFAVLRIQRSAVVVQGGVLLHEMFVESVDGGGKHDVHVAGNPGGGVPQTSHEPQHLLVHGRSVGKVVLDEDDDRGHAKCAVRQVGHTVKHLQAVTNAPDGAEEGQDEYHRYHGVCDVGVAGMDQLQKKGS